MKWLGKLREKHLYRVFFAMLVIDTIVMILKAVGVINLDWYLVIAITFIPTAAYYMGIEILLSERKAREYERKREIELHNRIRESQRANSEED